MSVRGKVLLRQWAFGGFIGLIGLAMFPSAPLAAVGTVLRTVNLPAEAKCDEVLHSPALVIEFGPNFGNQFLTTKGISAAAVQGSKVGHPEHPVLLVTSCVSTFATNQTKASSLYFLAPTTPIATLVKTINTREATATAGVFFAPPLGWGALVYRPDKGDLLACGNGGSPPRHPIYSIDISVFNNPTIPDGTVTHLFDAQPLGSTALCDGLAWDPSNDTIYQGPDVATADGIKHFSQTGELLSTFNTPFLVTATCEGEACIPTLTRCPKSGLALVGGTLFVACDGELQVHQLDKTTKARIRAFVTPPDTRTEDLECDPITFAAQGKDAIWTRDVYPVRYTEGANVGEPIVNLDNETGALISTGDQQLFAMELPMGTCGFPTGPTVLNPGACPAGYPTNPDGSPKDTDGDGLLDCWEDGTLWADGLPGINFDGDAARDIVLCVDANANGVFDAGECSDKNVKDLFVEFDAMREGTVVHAPSVADVTAVVTAFANAPVENPAPNEPGPGGTGPTGIRLHVQRDDLNIPEKDNTAMPPCTPAMPQPPGPEDADFDTLKNNWFGTVAERGLAEPQRAKTLAAKKMAFRYGLGVHNLTRPANTASPSGCAEVPGNDFIVALGSFGSGTHRNGVGTQQYWPGTFMHELGHTLGLRHGGGDNFNCKPNYLSVMSYTRQFKTVITDRPLDYSRQVLLELNEAILVEALGVGSPPVPLEQAPGAPAAKTVHGPGTAKKPAATGAISWDADTLFTEEILGLNINQIGSVTGCNGDGGVLVGYDDWANLVYNLRATFDFADGIHSSAEEVLEITEPQAQELVNITDADGDGVTDKNACAGAACVIDIVPGVASNKVLLFQHNGTTKAIVPVAVLSTVLFDATMLDSHTMTFAGTPVSQVFGKPVCARLDVNRDGRRDHVCTFVLIGLSPGEQTAVLEGTTLSGIAIRAEGTMLAVEITTDD